MRRISSRSIGTLLSHPLSLRPTLAEPRSPSHTTKISDDDLMRFGKAARSLCRDPRCPDTFKSKLQEARAEWRRRHPKAQ